MNFLFTRGYFISSRVWGLRESSSVYRKSIPGFRLDLHFRKSRGYIFPEYDTLLIIKNLSNMWKCDPKKWVHLFGKTPMVCFLIRFTVGCIKLNLNLYNFVYEESHYTYTAHTLQHVPNSSYIRWVITFKIYLAHNASVKLSPVSSANNKMPFYCLQNFNRLAVFNNVCMRSLERGMVILVQFVLWRDSNFFKKLGQNENWELELKFPWVLSFRFTTKTCLIFLKKFNILKFSFKD